MGKMGCGTITTIQNTARTREVRNMFSPDVPPSTLSTRDHHLPQIVGQNISTRLSGSTWCFLDGAIRNVLKSVMGI